MAILGTSLRRSLGVVAATLLAAGTLAACGSQSGSTTGSDTINYALPASFTPNWILPIGAAGKLNTNNGSIAGALWEPLIAYDGSTGTVDWHKEAGIASAADFDKAGTSVTITLAKRTWSDGKPITSRDVEFWFNLVKANKKDWAGYDEGFVPDNWTKLTATDDTHLTIQFDKAYNPQWMLADQLSMITPLPQHAWDRTSASGKVGDYDRDPAGAKQVWTTLNKAASDLSSYATNPLWKVTSGPYTLSKFSTSGNVTLAASTKYDGGTKPQIKTVNLLPFTSAQAEENAVRSGEVDYGYISPTSMSSKASFTQQGYQVKPWTGWAITYLPYNFNNPTLGPAFKQLYVRQAIQRSVDQKGLVKAVFGGTATAGYGPIPQSTKSDFLPDGQATNAYAFDTAAAKKLLTDHGWKPGSDGILVCESAGSAADQCGPGVKAGTKLTMEVFSQSGSDVTDNEMSALQSSLKKAGIGFTIKTAPVNTVLAQTPPCKPTEPVCKWQLSYFGTAGSWYFPAYPTGNALFQTGGSANFGGYSNPAADKLIAGTTASADTSAIKQYGDLLAKDLPVIWLPEPDYQISVVKKGLEAPQDPMANFHPARWKWTS